MVTASDKRRMADDVHHACEALRLDGVESTDAFKIIQSDVREETGRLYSVSTIKSYVPML